MLRFPCALVLKCWDWPCRGAGLLLITSVSDDLRVLLIPAGARSCLQTVAFPMQARSGSWFQPAFSRFSPLFSLFNFPHSVCNCNVLGLTLLSIGNRWPCPE